MDLTNRCNMMCNPCFMDANQVGYVHEPTFEDIKAILDQAVSFKPRRQMIILFSGGEPTISPIFWMPSPMPKRSASIVFWPRRTEFDLPRKRVSPGGEAGLHGVYLQFDGTSEEKNKHRGVGNLLDVKLRAIGKPRIGGHQGQHLSPTIVNRINNDAIGPIVEFAVKISTRSRPSPFSRCPSPGEMRSRTRPYEQRYTLAGMVEDLKDQLAARGAAARLVPALGYTAFTSVMDILQGPDAPGVGRMQLPPNCGIFTLLVV